MADQFWDKNKLFRAVLQRVRVRDIPAPEVIVTVSAVHDPR
jgi:hypothetical protein